jgi:glycosyltransferase involved in cell wall biosynthesis
MVSVVIPAHNEQAVIGRCLERLSEGTAADELEVIVVANGCTDQTAELAATFPGVTVIDTSVASKHAALVLGDRAVSHFPRAFVDADVEVTASALVSTAAAMEAAGALVAAPALHVDLHDCPWGVRAYYRVWCALGWSTDAPVGSGLYMLSASGRQRIGEFPDITNDDQFVHDSFLAQERLCVEQVVYVIRPARTMTGLVHRRTRTLHGQIELRERFGSLPGAASGPTPAALVRRDPRRVLDVAVFFAITLLAKRAVRRKRSTGDVRWERDDTSRVTAASP